MSTSESNLLSFLKEVLHVSIARLDEIDERVERHEELLGTLSSQVESLIVPAGRVVDYQLGIEQWGIPQSVRKMVNRKSTVQRMERILTANNWFAIHGDIQSGKTHLAIEIARKWRRRVLWINLSGLTAAQASQQLDAGLKSVNGDSIPASVPEFFETACHALGKGSLIVLDGLPKSQSLDLFERRLISLEQACFGNDVKLLSTSSGKIPSGVVDRLNGELAEEQAPRFSGEDRRDLFRLSGAPNRSSTSSFRTRSDCSRRTTRYY